MLENGCRTSVLHVSLNVTPVSLLTWPWLFERWITLSTLDIQWIAWFVLLTFIYWIAIYTVDNIIQALNNWGLNDALEMACSK